MDVMIWLLISINFTFKFHSRAQSWISSCDQGQMIVHVFVAHAAADYDYQELRMTLVLLHTALLV